MRLHGESSPIPSATDGDPAVPPRLTLAPNVYIVGTVNVDETTHPFSRKVLDRAMTIELFDVNLRMSGRRNGPPITADEAQLVRRFFVRDGTFVSIAEPAIDDPALSTAMAKLVEINDRLARSRLHVGYRVRNEILEFVRQAGEEGLLGLTQSAAKIDRS